MQEAISAIAQEAQQKNNTAKLAKLQEMVSVLQAASAPPELALIEHMLEHSDNFEAALNEHEAEITPQFIEILANLMMQMDQQQGKQAMSPDDLATLSKLEALYKAALKWQMMKNKGE
jgi:molecular chaperone GrpE (heat shock protein)